MAPMILPAYVILSELDLLSASRDAKPNFGHLETDRDHTAIFSTAATRIRVTLRDGAIAKRQMILGEELADGSFRGPLLGQETLNAHGSGDKRRTIPTALAAAEDALALNRQRLEALQSNGISPATQWALLVESQRHLSNANEALLQGDIAGARLDGMRASATAMRAYPDVINLANDVVYALVVMLIFAIPFAYLCERLFISANTVNGRVIGFGGFFTATFGFLYFFHPAFSLATTPAIILLAFCIIVMSSQVIIILGNRFEYEMEQIRLTALGIRKVDVNRLSTLLATGTLGISNMRRRPLRTFLTGSTVVLMTFIMLTFADFTKNGGTLDRPLAKNFLAETAYKLAAQALCHSKTTTRKIPSKHSVRLISHAFKRITVTGLKANRLLPVSILILKTKAPTLKAYLASNQVIRVALTKPLAR